ncbi:hypothetical protein AGOR_G00121830 [Albula goreensis]|uniref:Secreted protein n=1 Tax=Albula goreensis TaxID=1534307 RepID=A0A8T3DAH0_9TELE|nr:hypothetical protein AGOR_G00121830 [Albula goreensis]
MLATMLTAMYLAVRVAEQLGARLVRSEPLPYTVTQPMPWQVQCVSQGRRGSRVDEFGFERRNSVGGHRRNSGRFLSNPAHLDKAATTIQSQYRRYQQRKQKGRRH